MNTALQLFNGNRDAPVAADPRRPLGNMPAENGVDIVRAYEAAFLGGQVSERTRSAILARLDDPALGAPGPLGARRYRVEKLAALVLGSPDFQRR